MRLRWTPHARDDLFRSADLEDDPHIETALLRGIAVATGQLQVHPRIGPAIGGTRIRKWPIAGTAFLFLYMVRDDMIVIMRIVPNRSDWQTLPTSPPPFSAAASTRGRDGTGR